MSETLYYILLALVAGSVGSVALAGLIMLANDKWLHIISTHLTYLAGGTMLGAAFLGMIPNAIAQSEGEMILMQVLGGIFFFFILEKLIIWRTCGKEDCERHLTAAVPMVLLGDAFHNAIDGVVIAAAFMTSPELGVFVTLSVVLHEVPQELGDFGILIRGGMSRAKALFYNILSGATAILFGVLAYFFMEGVQSLIPFALAFSASSFIYIALADLIPEMHKKTKVSESLSQIALVLAGILIILMIKH